MLNIRVLWKGDKGERLMNPTALKEKLPHVPVMERYQTMWHLYLFRGLWSLPLCILPPWLFLLCRGQGRGWYPGCGTVTSFNSSFCLLSPLSNLTCLSCSFLAPVRWAEISMKKKSRGWKLLSGQEVDESLARWSLLRKRNVLNKVGDRKLLAPVLSYPRPPFSLSAFSGLIFCSWKPKVTWDEASLFRAVLTQVLLFVACRSGQRWGQ